MKDRATGEEVARAPKRRRARDRGYSIIEVIVTITIMGIVMVPILNAFIATITTSSQTGTMAEMQTVLQNAADRVNRAPKVCDYTVYAQAAAQSEGWNASQVTIVQQHWVPGATAVANGAWVTNACGGTLPTELLVQLVSITVNSPNGNLSRTIQVVKSDV